MGDRRRGGGRGYPPSGDRGDRGGYPPQERGGYKVLCVSALHPKASDDVVRDTLYREYKKYGDISVRVMHEPDERVAYVYFRSFEDARDAKHSKSRIILFDKATLVEAVFESATREEYESRSGGGRPRSLSPPRYGGGGGGNGYGRQRSPDRYRDDYRDDHWGGGGDRRGPPPPRRGGRDDGGYHRGGHPGHRGGHMRDDFRGPPPRGPPRGPPPGYHDDHYNNYGGAMPPPIRRENKKDKFPNYMDHLPPEDDPLATRTLFAGNLELNITDDEMHRIFGKYGRLVDVDIKRPPPGTGNAYAFIRYETLDMAEAAKRELSGQYIGKFQCKIGYGKVVQTTKVWIGGLGHWCSKQMLEREFDRFGVMGRIDYEKGDPEATIQYESIDAASAAVNEMRGFPLGGPDKRIRIDYSDVENMPQTRGYQGSDYDPNIARRGRGYYNTGPGRGGGGYHRGGGGGRGGDGGYHGGGRGGGHDDWGKRPGEYLDGPPNRIRKMDSRSPEGRDGIASAKSITDLSRRIEKCWEGGLILKNSLFPTKLLLTEGEHDVVEQLMQDEHDQPYLKITQRLRLDQAKLDDVSKRISSSSSHAIFLALTTSSASVPLPQEGEVQSRPLKNLVSYLKQKDAAGVISLHNRETEQNGVLYAFPPCLFSLDLMRRVACNLSDESSKDDHLVVVVVKGT